MSNTKKCPNCGEWSTWNLSLEDKCEFCGKLLQEKELNKSLKKKSDKEKQEKEFIFHINKGDNIFTKAIKKGGYVVYIIIMSIASFLSWLLFWLGP